MNRRRLVACVLGPLVASAALAWAGDANAYVREMSNWDPTTLPIPYGINLSTLPPAISSGGQAAVEAAFATWAGPVCTAWRATDTGNVSRMADSNDMLNTILWVSGSWPAELGDVNSTIGITTPVWQTPGYFIDADIQFNNVGFTWSLDGSPNTVDTQSIATHEEGHFLGLDHTPVAEAIMYASYSGGIKRTLASDDEMGVCAIYPSGQTAPQDAGSQPTDSGTQPVDTGPVMGTGTTGTPCNSGSDCASGLCVQSTDQMGNTHTFCTQTCTMDCDCPNGYACYPTGQGESVCAPGANSCQQAHDSGSTAPGLGQLGDPCMSGTDCSMGICASAPGIPAFCTRFCNTDCDCPGGYQCYPTSTAGRMVCGPGTNPCTTTQDGGVTLDAGGSGARDSGASHGDANAANDGAPSNDGGTGSENTGVTGGGCHCGIAPGTRTSGGSRALALGGILALATISRRRRDRRRR